MKKIFKLFIFTVFTFIIVSGFPAACFCAEPLNAKDIQLLTDRAAWSAATEEAQFQYALSYLSRINEIMGLPANTFPAKNVHMMSPLDPAYGLACGYTDYATGQIYLCMPKINSEGLPGWGTVFALAHETRHLYQSRFNTIPYNPESVISNQAVYNTDAREKDANTFAICFIDNVLGRTDWR